MNEREKRTISYTVLTPNSGVTCRWTVRRTDHVLGGIESVSKCGKTATHEDENKRGLCLHHFNRWFTKKIDNR